MMRKFVLIPVISLGWKTKAMFLEIISEPACFGGADFKPLKKSGLAAEVANTEKALKVLAYHHTAASHLYLGNHFLNLDSLKSISLGLALAAFMQQKSCHYQKIIAIGAVDSSDDNLEIVGGDYFAAQLNAILKLDRQPDTVPLFLPAATTEDKGAGLEAELAKKNICLQAVGNLYQALEALGIHMTHRPDLLSR